VDSKEGETLHDEGPGPQGPARLPWKWWVVPPHWHKSGLRLPAIGRICSEILNTE